jgi:hypothetical protein
LTLLAVNAIPAAGWFLAGWPAGTTLVVYWFETVAACAFVSARHRCSSADEPTRYAF